METRTVETSYGEARWEGPSRRETLVARILGQLFCRQCKQRFWPAPGESATLVILCPHCQSSYANPDALPELPRVNTRYALAWLHRHWLDRVPYMELTATMSDGRTLSVSTFEADGFPVCLVEMPGMELYQGLGTTFYGRMIFFAAYLPRPLTEVNGFAPNLLHMRGGFAWREPTRMAPLEPRLMQLAAYIRSLGARPLWALEEVPDPTPLDAEQESRELSVRADEAADAHLEAMSIRCHQCGAPSAPTGLIGTFARCPFCAAPQQLSPELAAELSRYRQRVHAARLRMPTLSLSGIFQTSLSKTASGLVLLVCAHCGAPNAHRPGALDEPCASCRAPLVPSRAARARAVEAEVRRAGRAHGHDAIRHAVKRRSAHALMMRTIYWSAVALVIALGAWVSVIVGVGLSDMQRDPSMFFVYAPAAFCCGLVGLALIWAVVKLYLRSRQRRWLVQVDALGEQLGASLGSGADLLGWADRWWNDRVPEAFAGAEATQRALATSSDGFPTVIGADRDGTTVVFLAAELPRDVQYWARSPAVRLVWDDLTRAGFKLELGTGGLALAASSALKERFASQPERLMLLAPTVTALSRLAHLLRAEPPIETHQGSS
jgi:hypothetical protein